MNFLNFLTPYLPMAVYFFYLVTLVTGVFVAYDLVEDWKGITTEQKILRFLIIVSLVWTAFTALTK